MLCCLLLSILKENFQGRYLRAHLVSTFYFRYADTASSSLKNQYVLFVKLLRISGFVFFAVLLVVGGNKSNFSY